MFECVILAGGFGTRLKSISGNIPKPMVKVGDSPFLYKLMRNLEEQGCNNIVISTHFEADYIIKNISHDKPVSCNIDFVVEDQPLGTGGAIKFASEKIKSDKFIVINGDTYHDLDYLDFIQNSNHSDLLISAVKVDNCSRYGSISVDSEYNIISLYTNSISTSGVINSGTYAIKKSDIQSFNADIFSFEDDFLKTYQGKFKAYINENIFIDIGIPEDYHRACEMFK